MDKNITISFRTILLTIALIILAWFLIQIKGILMLLFVALIITLALDPLVDSLEKKRKWPRIAAVSVIYLFLIAALIFISSFIIKPLVEQTTALFLQLPHLFSSLVNQKTSDSLLQHLTSSSGGMIKATLGAFSNIFNLLTILVFTFYLLLDFDKVKEGFIDFFPSREQKKIKKLFSDIETKLGSWLRGEIVLMTVIGLFSFVGLSLLKVKYALALSLFAGFLEILPMIGPTISLVPAVIVAGADSLWLGAAVFFLYILIQQVENNVIVPKVMQKAVGFNPLITIIALLVGGKLFGAAGALLAVPVLAVGVIITKFLFNLEE